MGDAAGITFGVRVALTVFLLAAATGGFGTWMAAAWPEQPDFGRGISGLSSVIAFWALVAMGVCLLWGW